MPTHVFDLIMAMVLAVLSVVVIRLRPHAERAIPRGATRTRELTDAHGEVYRYQVPLGRGTLYSAGVGLLSSFLGIGGGVIHVPLMAGALGFPTRIATATSHFVLVFMSGTASATHLIGGTITVGHGLRRAIALSIGVLPGPSSAPACRAASPAPRSASSSAWRCWVWRCGCSSPRHRRERDAALSAAALAG